MSGDSYGEFFRNEDALMIVDMMAQRYGRLPHELMTELTVHEFNLNAAVMLSAVTIELARKQEAQTSLDKVQSGDVGKQFTTLKDFGVKVKTVKKEDT